MPVAGLVGLGVTVLVLTASSASRAQTIDCSMYGEGYVAVQGTARCVHIRGRMRVNQASGHYRPSSFLPPSSASPMTLPHAAPLQPSLHRWPR